MDELGQMQPKLKILFYNFTTQNRITAHGKTQNPAMNNWLEQFNGRSIINLSIAPLYFQSYIIHNRPELLDQYEWTDFVYEPVEDQQALADIINQQGIDVLCLGLYVWNSVKILADLKGLKALLHNPNVIIIAGGPSVSPQHPELIAENPDIDYAVYNQGDKIFADLLGLIIAGKRPNIVDHSNVMWLSKGRAVITQSRWDKLADHANIYLENQDLLARMVEKYRSPERAIEIVWETTKGCVYACTFCSWNSGNKPRQYKRYNIEYTDEFRLFADLGIHHLSLGDANFGMYKQDLEIAQNIVDLQKEGLFFQFRGYNFAKLQKERVFEIYDLFYKAGMFNTPRISCQDLDPQVLLDIDRPEKPWAENLALINDFRAKNPTAPIEIELILGLPGATRQSWINTLTEIASHNFLIRWSPFQDIPGAPASTDRAYRDRMKLQTKDFHDSVAKFWSTYFVSSYSYDHTDWLFFVYLVNILEVMRSAGVPSSTFLKLCPHLVGRDSLNIWLQGNTDNTDLSSIVQHCSAFLLEEIEQLNLGYTQSMKDLLTQQISTTTYHKSKRDYQ
jgi:tRNA A37 methylthiotransferase MiaB